ncbi:hypothetical protein PG985_012664 [Apiospora marii]|uniref:CS domain-containing protein n=1 Tax=Apiospora marii TaxID=335849 RepID=A0ABR1RDQ3_9PEZI
MPRPTRTSQKAEQELAIGVDIGTTNSSVNYGKTGPLPRGDFDIRIVRGWEWCTKSMDSESIRVPTEIVYTENGEVRWGYDIPHDVDPLRYVKLLLYDEQGLPDYLEGFPHLDEMRERIAKLGKTPVTVLADYLKGLWEHSLKRIDEELGISEVRALPFRVVFTVPAIWTEKTKESMRIAIRQAGILDKRLAGETSLRFIAEPEAAAISILNTLPASDVKRGVKLLVNDYGGGTVDLTPYEITKIESPRTVRKLTLKECAPGTGGLFGATFLDQAFFKYFNDFMKSTNHDWDKITAAYQKRTMNDYWESNIKPGFTEKSEREWSVILPSGTPITLDKHGLSSVFRDSVVSSILELVRGQVKRISEDGGQALKLFLLAGGFGQCNFIHEALKDELDKGIKIIRLPRDEPRNAISRGAVLDAILRKSHSAPVEERKSRHSYIFLHDEPWNSEKHNEDAHEKAYDDIREEYRAKNLCHCAIHKGDGVGSKSVPFEGDLTILMDRREAINYSVSLYKTRSENPPGQLKSNESDMQKVGDVVVKFDAIEELPVERNTQGKQVRKLYFQMRTEVSGESIDVWAEKDGTEIGRLKLDLYKANHEEPWESMFVGGS